MSRYAGSTPYSFDSETGDYVVDNHVVQSPRHYDARTGDPVSFSWDDEDYGEVRVNGRLVGTIDPLGSEDRVWTGVSLSKQAHAHPARDGAPTAFTRYHAALRLAGLTGYAPDRV